MQTSQCNPMLHEQVLVLISCRNLKLDLVKQINPIVKVSLKNCQDGSFSPIGQTELLINQQNPDFKETVRLPFCFETRQFVRFDIFHLNMVQSDSTIQDSLGYVQTELSRMVGANKQTLTLDLIQYGVPSSCKLITRCKVEEKTNQKLILCMRGIQLANTDSVFQFLDKSDPYLRFMKLGGDGSRVPFQKTKYINNELNPVWRPIAFQLDQLGNDRDKSFIIECWDHQDQRQDQYIGELQTTVNKLADSAVKNETLSMVSRMYSKPGLIACDSVTFTKCRLLGFLLGGLKLIPCPFVDFTKSNGDPKQKDSLHFISPDQPNNYQLALCSLSEILLNYSTDSTIQAYGFGAQIPGFAGTSQYFPLSLNPDLLAAKGLSDLLAQYQNCLKKVSLSGPAQFAPIVSKAAKLAKQQQSLDQYAYLVQLVLTSSGISESDLMQTTRQICNAALLPLSIIIVGIGDAEFKSWVRLDGEQEIYPRDMVQFVSFSRVCYQKEWLRKQVLAKLSRQIEEYYQLRGIQIKPRMPSVPIDQSERARARTQYSAQCQVVKIQTVSPKVTSWTLTSTQFEIE